jgi:hypothetical protein
VGEETSGSTRKYVQNYLLSTCISNLILAIHTQSVNGLEEPFQDIGEKFLQPTCSGCKAEICTTVSQQYMVPRVCIKWVVPFSLEEGRTEISEILLW